MEPFVSDLDGCTGCFSARHRERKISLGDAMPAITLSSEIYGKVTPADLKGKVVLVSLFATWCGPCQIELAEVQKTLWPKYKDNKDFKLLVIGREHTDAELKNIMNGRSSVFRSIRTLNGKSSLFCGPDNPQSVSVREIR